MRFKRAGQIGGSRKPYLKTPHLNGVQEAVGSNPAAPTISPSSYSRPTHVSYRVGTKNPIDVNPFGGGGVGKLTLEPGWRWSQHVKPITGTATGTA